MLVVYFFLYCSLIKLHNNFLPKPNQLYKFDYFPYRNYLSPYIYTFKFKTIMTKTTFICSLGFLFILMACDAGDYEQDPNLGIHSSDTSVIALQGKPGRTDLAFITQQLIAGYSTQFDDTNKTLSQKIVLLDSASLYAPLFSSLKPV